MKLDLNCNVEYFPNFLSKEDAKNIYEEITRTFKIAELTNKKINETAFISANGKLMFIDQDLMDSNKFPEEQWGKTTVWTEKMLKVKQKIEAITEMKFQVCVCIYYPNGNTGVGYHSDFVAFGDTSFIPSISLGEEREFLLREKSTQREHEILLEEGSMIIMGEHCQERYEHSLPINPKYKNGRINLTFRKYGF